jgi:hypothetical protein
MMEDFSKTPRSDDHTVGHDAGVVLDLPAKARQERDVPALDEERPVERQVLAAAWGTWCW